MNEMLKDCPNVKLSSSTSTSSSHIAFFCLIHKHKHLINLLWIVKYFTIDSKVLCKLGQIHDFDTFYFETLSMCYDLLNWKILIFCFQCLLIGQQYGVKLFRWNSVFSGIVKCRTVIPYSWIVQLTGIHCEQTNTVVVNKENQSIFVSLFLNIDRRKFVLSHRRNLLSA